VAVAPAVTERFQGTDRFEVRRRLGAGGFGVVYEAFDRQRAAPVALKTLHRQNPEALYRFKREFRALADVVHPNLVTLYELFADGEQWFFTLELVQGTTFLEHVRDAGRPDVETASPDESTVGDARLATPTPARPAAPPCDAERLRSALRQLAEGLLALHRAGKLHRDLKPSNVLVTRAGRVVILDFGVVHDLAADAALSTAVVAGTPAYMSPEQGSGRPLSEASDWYSVGVMLYEALTGWRPFLGTPLEVQAGKLTRRPRPPDEIVPGLPDDLVALCADLLRREPEARATGRDVLRRLGGERPGAVAAPPPPTAPAPAATLLVARERHLAALSEAYEAMQAGRAVVVRVHGASGMGKTALVRRFLDVAERDGGALVLAGRCYERESVPYKTLDSLVDALARHLGRLAPIDAEVLLPRDILALARVFPALQRVEAIAGARRRVAEIADAHELRRRACGALRELLARMTDRGPLVLFIDDVQWGDLDSAALLDEALRPPDSPPVLLVLAHRSEDVATSPGLRALLEATDRPGLDARDVPVGELAPEEALAVARVLLKDAVPAATLAARGEAIARESRGSPFFVHELARYVLSGLGSQPDDLTLEDVIDARVAKLPAEARRLLEVLAVAAGPVETSVAVKGARLAAAGPGAVAALRAAHLIRTRKTDSGEDLETYHDRVRETVAARVSAETRRAHHRAIAEALEGSGAAAADPLALVRHLEGAGDPARAARAAEEAARIAFKALAFDRATDLYSTALRLGTRSAEDARRLAIARAEALACAEHGARAAEAYLAAAEGADPLTRLECRRLAAEHLLGCGHVEQGIEVLKEVLGALGERYPATEPGALLSFLFRRAWLRLRGLRFRRREAGSIPPLDLMRIDACHAVAVTLPLVDVVRAADFATRSAIRALRSGEPHRVARALALEAVMAAGGGVADRARSWKLLAAARPVAPADPGLEAHILACTGVTLYYHGRFQEAFERLRETEDRWLAVGMRGLSVWQRKAARNIGLFALSFMGSYRELQARFDGQLREAERRSDRVEVVCLRWGFPDLWLAADDPALALGNLDRIEWPGRSRSFGLPHWLRLRTHGLVDLYLGKGGGLDRHRPRFAAFDRSPPRRNNLVRSEGAWMRGRFALLDAEASRDAAPLLAIAAGFARKLERRRLPYADTWAMLLRAGIAFQEGDPGRAAAALRDAIAIAEAHHTLGCAAAARRRLGQVLGGTEGAALIARADRWYASEGVADPERFTRMLAPGFRRPP